MNISNRVLALVFGISISTSILAATPEETTAYSQMPMMNQGRHMMMNPQMMQHMQHMPHMGYGYGMPMMGQGMGNMPMNPMMMQMMQMRMQHMQKMEQHLANIESLLTQLLEAQKSE